MFDFDPANFDPGYEGDDETRSMHSIIQLDETVQVFCRTRSEGYEVSREVDRIRQNYPAAKTIEILCFCNGSYGTMLSFPIEKRFR